MPWLARPWLARPWLARLARPERVAALIAPAASPLPLALLRIVLPIVLLLSPEPDLTRQLVARDRTLTFAPEGLGWLPDLLAAIEPWLEVVQRTFQLSAVTSAVGLWTRPSLCVLTACFILLFGGAQLSGTVIHDMHLSWMLALLIASPCGRALSLDAWLRGKDGLRPPASRPAGAALFGARLMLGWVYLFPGLEKLRVSGLEWALSDNLLNQMQLKWFMADGRVPWPRPDHFPSLVRAAGLLVIAFELSFLILVLSRRGRPIAAGAGLAFHAGAAHFLYIPFPSLWACYVVLWDGPTRPASELPGNGPLPRAPLLTTLVLSTAIVVQGVRGQTQAWPFACYPSFAALASDRIVDLAVEVEVEGRRFVLREPTERPSVRWGATWRVMGLYGAPPSRRALVAHARELAARLGHPELPLEQATLRFFAEEYSTRPQARGAPPRRRWRLPSN